LPNSRLEIIRHFSYQSHCVSVGLSTVDDIFELRFPRLQIFSNSENRFEPGSTSGDYQNNNADTDVEKKVLRREIKSWWQGVAEHIDKLVCYLLCPVRPTFNGHCFQEELFIHDQPRSFSKSLPRLPSTFDDDDGVDAPADVTPKARASDLPSQSANTSNIMLLHSGPMLVPESSGSSRPMTPNTQTLALPPLAPSASRSHSQQSDLSGKNQSGDASSPDNAPPPITKDGDSGSSLYHLQNLRHSFQRTEQSLYALLSRTPVSALNDVRTSFLSAARGATRRLSAWQKKHLSKARLTVGDLSVQEPEWWQKGCHTIPGRNIIVREDDWGSIIAFTLGWVQFLLMILFPSHLA
jgi:1-phosphatidylinositol-3-phosphate 5-kinase